MRRDYYAVLGITATAAPREVRQAYRRLARQYSPDVNFWDERARALFDEIAEAYRVLIDPAARGAARTLQVARFSACDRCGARGRDATGSVCATCGGRGVARDSERVTVDVPAGADSGVQFRVADEGSAGPFGGPRGDLIVTVRVAEHPWFVRKGDNVHCELPVSVWEALRGARIKIPTPQGEAAVVIPTGTADGTVLRVRGHGLPSLTREGLGDLHVTVRVLMPTGLDARTDELVRDLERLAPLEPRVGMERFQGGAA